MQRSGFPRRRSISQLGHVASTGTRTLCVLHSRDKEVLVDMAKERCLENKPCREKLRGEVLMGSAPTYERGLEAGFPEAAHLQDDRVFERMTWMMAMVSQVLWGFQRNCRDS